VVIALVVAVALRWLIRPETVQEQAPEAKVQKKEPPKEPRIFLVALPKDQTIEKLPRTSVTKERLKRSEKPRKSASSPVVPMKKARKRSVRQNRMQDHMVKVTRRYASSGMPLLRRGAQRRITLDYGDIGFRQYFSLMRAMGGALFIGDNESRTLLARVDLWDNGGQIRFRGFEDIGHSDNLAISYPRDITDEALLRDVIESGKKRFVAEDLRCAFILPVEKEAAILGALDESIRKAGYKMRDLSLIEGRYYKQGGSFGILITKGRMEATGRSVPLGIKLDLSPLR